MIPHSDDSPHSDPPPYDSPPPLAKFFWCPDLKLKSDICKSLAKVRNQAAADRRSLGTRIGVCTHATCQLWGGIVRGRVRVRGIVRVGNHGRIYRCRLTAKSRICMINNYQLTQCWKGWVLIECPSLLGYDEPNWEFEYEKKKCCHYEIKQHF